ncbi:MAG: hypothetical protein ACTSP4_16160 [Candidatus Hodarchaeales archaeon]
MASWSTSFKYSVIFLIYYIIWLLIGTGIIIFGGTIGLTIGGSLGSLIALVSTLVGLFIVFFGGVACLIKVASDAS